jgi:hypothetical protein
VLQARPGQAKEIEILVLLQRRNPRPRLRWTSAPRQATPPPRPGASIHALRWDRLGALVHDYLQSYEVTQFSAPTVLRGSLTFVEQDFAPRCAFSPRGATRADDIVTSIWTASTAPRRRSCIDRRRRMQGAGAAMTLLQFAIGHPNPSVCYRRFGPTST